MWSAGEWAVYVLGILALIALLWLFAQGAGLF